jgi:LacI family transcriptional regulator
MGKNSSDIREVAALAGVSVGTVSNVLNRPAAVADATLQAVLRAIDEPDAVFCANDMMALGVLRGLFERGRSVPDDIALIGFDDIEFARLAAVPLTSVRQPAT